MRKRIIYDTIKTNSQRPEAETMRGQKALCQ
jgi:hypothetical protein